MPMPNDSIICDTPRYVLLEDREPIGPEVIQVSSEGGCVAVYGFSGKQACLVFSTNSDRALRPYPLTKGYLKNRIEEQTDETHLIIIDAVAPTDECLTAATMEHVLAAQNGGGPRMKNGFHIMLCQNSGEYEWNGVAT